MRLVTIGSQVPAHPSVVRHRRRGRATALVAVALFSVSLASVEASAAASTAADPKVISDWNAVAFDTIVVDAGKANAEAFMWFAFEQAAVYNAVVGITRAPRALQVERSWASGGVTAGRRRSGRA